jgi:hypothetical protein
MFAMYLKGDWSGQNGCQWLGAVSRPSQDRHACAISIWRVPGLFSMVHGRPGLLLSTLQVCSTWWPRAGQSIDAGHGSASWSGKKEEVAHRRRRAGAQRLRTYLRHMDCQRAALWPAGSPQARRIDDPAVPLVARPRDGHISQRWRAGRDGRTRRILGSHGQTVQGCASAALARVQAAAGSQRWPEGSPMVKINIQCATIACDTPPASRRPPSASDANIPIIYTTTTPQVEVDRGSKALISISTSRRRRRPTLRITTI